jgi:plasmid stabilization system protein ParE
VKRVVWSRDALDEFGGLVEYIAYDDPLAALGVADRIDEAIVRLAEMPTGRKGRVSGTYEKSVTGLPYIIAYSLSDESKGDAKF